MKTLILVFAFLIILFSSTYAQIGSVHSYQQITSNIGGFINTLGANDRFGAKIDTIGDLNNDGIMDIAVGAPLDDDGGSDRGAIYILYLDTNKSVKGFSKISSTSGNLGCTLANGSQFGIGLCGLGDIDNDGIPDIAVGAHHDPDGSSETGAVFILLMNSNGTVKSCQKISSLSGYGTGGLPLSAGRKFGVDIGCIGDINNDNIPDIVVGNFWDNGGGTNKGAIWVLTLDTNGTVKTYYKIHDGVTNFNAPIDNNDYFGSSVCGIGDIDNDNISDIAVGAFYDDDGGSQCGAVYLIKLNSNGSVKGYNKISNGNNGLPNNIIPSIAQFGNDVKLTQDIDRNGVNDLLVGAPGYGGYSGATYIIGLDTNLTSSVIKIINSSDISQISSGIRFGRSVAHIGDINNDGKIEIASGATYYNGFRGEIFIMSINPIQPGMVISEKKISDTQGNFTAPISSNNQFGWSLTEIGDIDNDGIPDLASGAPFDDDGGTNRGAVYIIFMNANGTVKSYQKISDTQGGFTGYLSNTDYLGGGISLIGDLNNDGINDIAVGAEGDDDGGSGSGTVWILFLDTNGTVKSHQKISNGNGNIPNSAISIVSYFGFDIASIGDLDNDGNNDIAVGAYGNNYNKGSVFILFLNSNGTVKNYQIISQGIGNFTGTLYGNNKFGCAITNLGDINGDNITDIAVGANGDDDGGTDKGAVYILFLDTNGTVKSHQKISDTQGNFTASLSYSDQFGYGVEKIGLIDNDSIPDLLVGAVNDDDGGSDKGAAYVLFLNSNGTVKSHQKISNTSGNFNGTLDSGDKFGHSISLMGDLDSDGYPEVAIGAPYDDDGGSNKGAFWLLSIHTSFSSTINASQNLCNGQCNGIATAIPHGGTPPYSYLWSNNSTNDTITNLCAGTYSVTITDALSNATSSSVTITQPPPLTIASSGNTNICAGSCTNLTATGIGGTPPLFYMWSGGLGLGQSKQVCPTSTSTYTVNSLDLNGCYSPPDTIIVNVIQPPTVSFTGLSASYCQNSPAVLLVGSPTSGTFSGNGIFGNGFSPAIAGIGTHNIIYNYSNGICTGSDTQTVIIHSLPIVSFTGLDTSYCHNAATATLVGTPSGGTFNGNGISGNVFNPSSINPGVYSIVYSYTDAYGCSNSHTKNTHINSVPLANAGTNITILYNSNATLFGSASGGSGIYSYSWSPADSLVSANVQNPTTINLKSTNIFTLTVTDLITGCQDTSQVVVTVPFQISSYIISSPQSICSGDSSQLIVYTSGGSGNYTYSWASNPIGFTSTISNPIVSPSITSTYTVTVSSGTLTTADTTIITVNPTPVVSFTGLLNSYCIISQAVTLIGNPSGGNFIGNGIIGNTFNPSTAGVGSHQIVYSFANTFGCFNKDTQIVIINSLPAINFTGLAQNYCTNSTPDTLSGTPIGGTFSGTGITGNTFNPSIAGTGFFNITYSYTDANACSNSITYTTVVYPIPIANAGANKSIPCSSSGTMIGSGSTSGFSYSWLPTTGLSNPNIANPIASPSITTIYTLTITNNATGCYATDYVIVSVTGGPTAIVSPDTSVCGGALINLAASGGISYSWNTGDTIPNITVNPIITTDFSVTVTDAYGCSDADTTTISVFLLHIVNLGNDTTIKMSDTITLNAGAGFVSYLWNTNLITQTQLIDGPSLGEGIFTFYVDVIDSNQCSNSDTIEITIIDDSGLDLISQKSNILIYPNPTDGLLYMKFNQVPGKFVLITIFDLQGKMVFKSQIKPSPDSPYKIQLIDYPVGLYFIKIQSETFIVNKKLIVN